MDTEEYNQLKSRLQEEWVNLLRTKFGGRDFSVLNKKWKAEVYTLVARMIVADIELLGKTISGAKEE